MEGSELRDADRTDDPIIRVPERGHADVAPHVWRSLSGNSDFWQLVDSKMLAVTTPSRGLIRLSGTRWVGRITLGGTRLELTEKVEGALAALLGFATESAFRIVTAQSPTSELGDLAALLVRQFLKAAHQYASSGLEFRYASQSNVGSLGGGRIDITRTLSLRAQGLRHLIAFDQDAVTYDTAKNRVVLRALREVERISNLIALHADDIARARSMAILFGDSRDAEVLFGTRETFIGYAERLMADPEHYKERDMLALASVILAHESFEQSNATEGTAPRAWFLNLEELFERAVRRVMARACPAGTSVKKGLDSSPQRRVFTQVQDRYKADPDLVVASAAGTVAVGDVKYKRWEGSAGQDDIYQLLVHAATFEAEVAFLVYPDEAFSAHDLGPSTTGCRTWVFTVDMRSLDTNLQQALLEMNLPIRQPGVALPVAAQPNTANPPNAAQP